MTIKVLHSEAEGQIRSRNYENPCWGYRKGEDGEIESDIFDGALPKGWYDSPANIGKKASKTGKEMEAEEDAGESKEDNGGETVALMPPYADHSFNDLRKEIRRRTGVGADRSMTAPDLVAVLEELDKAEQPTEEAEE